MVVSKLRTSCLKGCREFWRRLIIVLVAVVVTVPVIMKSRPRENKSPVAAFSVWSAATGYVRIGGDVRHPGVYAITANAVTSGVIFLAEPIGRPQRYVSASNEAALLNNGADLRVLIDPDGTTRIVTGSLPTAERLVLGIPLDINVMNEADFIRVPGIGPVLAKRIIKYRQINGGSMTVQDLLYVEGIGQKKYLHLHKFFN